MKYWREIQTRNVPSDPSERGEEVAHDLRDAGGAKRGEGDGGQGPRRRGRGGRRVRRPAAPCQRRRQRALQGELLLLLLLLLRGKDETPDNEDLGSVLRDSSIQTLRLLTYC